MRKLLVSLVLVLCIGLLYVYAEEVSRYTPTDRRPQAEAPTAAATEESTGTDEEVSNYKPKSGTVAARANVDKFRMSESAVEDTASEE